MGSAVEGNARTARSAPANNAPGDHVPPKRIRFLTAGIDNLNGFGCVGRPTHSEELPQARFVKVAHWRLAARLDPFGMLPSQVFVNLLLKLGHGVDPVANSH